MTTSGQVLGRGTDKLFTVTDARDDVHRFRLLEDRAQAVAVHRVVVGQDDSDGHDEARSGSAAVTAVPCGSIGATLNRPPMSEARLRMESSP